MLIDAQDLNRKFYEKYDDTFLFRKADTLLFITDNLQGFRNFVEEHGGDSTEIDQRFVETLRAEVHFTEFHQFEAFFALLIAVYQELPHWLFLTTYSNREIKNKIKSFLEGDMKELTNGQMDTVNEFLQWSVYAKFISSEEQHSQNWQTNLDNIAWLLNRMSKKYLDGSEYNAYKHGLRVMTGPSSLKIHANDNPEGGTVLFSSNDSLRFLEVERSKNSSQTVRETFKHFNPIESLNHLYFMGNLIETIKGVRLAKINKEDRVKLNVFTNLDKEKLDKAVVRTKWSISIGLLNR